MSDSFLDVLSSEMMSIKTSLGNLVELIENWILPIADEEKRTAKLCDIRDTLRKHGEKMPAKDFERCMEHLDSLVGNSSQSDFTSSVYRNRLQQMFKTQIERLNMQMDQILTRVGRVVEEVRSPKKPAHGIIMAQEEERKRISREIHDGPAQSLASLTMRIDYCLAQINDPEVLEKELQDLKDSIARSLKDIRRFIFDLRPMALDDLGLIPTLEQFITGFKARTKVSVNIDVTGERKGMPLERELAVFRVVQEAVNNAYRHAKADSIHLFLAFEHEKKRLSGVVKDDGEGFDFPAVKKNYSSLNKLGLISMEERIRLAGGFFEIISTPGEGTIVSFWVPLK